MLCLGGLACAHARPRMHARMHACAVGSVRLFFSFFSTGIGVSFRYRQGGGGGTRGRGDGRRILDRRVHISKPRSRTLDRNAVGRGRAALFPLCGSGVERTTRGGRGGGGGAFALSAGEPRPRTRRETCDAHERRNEKKLKPKKREKEREGGGRGEWDGEAATEATHASMCASGACAEPSASRISASLPVAVSIPLAWFRRRGLSLSPLPMRPLSARDHASRPCRRASAVVEPSGGFFRAVYMGAHPRTLPDASSFPPSSPERTTLPARTAPLRFSLLLPPAPLSLLLPSPLLRLRRHSRVRRRRFRRA